MELVVGDVDALPLETPRTVRAGDRRITLVRTQDAVHALEHGCPHEGYALAQGEVRSEVLTCAWHNWKFRLADGRCLFGDEDVRTYPTTVDATGQVRVELTNPDPEVERPRLLRSLREGLQRNRVGQLARDTARLLRTSADPGELVWEAVAYGAPRAEFGWGHSIASAVDCLGIADRLEGDDRALPVVQALAGVAEVEIRQPLRPRPDPTPALPPDPASAFRAAIEAEAADRAEALVLAALEAGLDRDEMRQWFVAAVSDHHLAYGHGAIYTQKAFELLDRLGWDRAGTVLPNLVPSIVLATREDKLPYMRPFVRGLSQLDLDSLAQLPVDAGWRDDGRLRTALLGRDRTAPLSAMVEALCQGAGADGVLSTVSRAVGERLLGYDLATELDPHSDFGWLDITHGLTHANAVRWAWREQPGPDALRMVAWAVFLAWYTGREGWPPTSGSAPESESASESTEATRSDQVELAEMADRLERTSLEDRAGSFIVAAHHVKTARAAGREAAAASSSLPLAGTAHYMASPAVDRFVRNNVVRALDLVSGRGPADRSEAG